MKSIGSDVFIISSECKIGSVLTVETRPGGIFKIKCNPFQNRPNQKWHFDGHMFLSVPNSLALTHDLRRGKLTLSHPTRESVQIWEVRDQTGHILSSADGKAIDLVQVLFGNPKGTAIQLAKISGRSTRSQRNQRWTVIRLSDYILGKEGIYSRSLDIGGSSSGSGSSSVAVLAGGGGGDVVSSSSSSSSSSLSATATRNEGLESSGGGGGGGGNVSPSSSSSSSSSFSSGHRHHRKRKKGPSSIFTFASNRKSAFQLLDDHAVAKAAAAAGGAGSGSGSGGSGGMSKSLSSQDLVRSSSENTPLVSVVGSPIDDGSGSPSSSSSSSIFGGFPSSPSSFASFASATAVTSIHSADLAPITSPVFQLRWFRDRTRLLIASIPSSGGESAGSGSGGSGGGGQQQGHLLLARKRDFDQGGRYHDSAEGRGSASSVERRQFWVWRKGRLISVSSANVRLPKKEARSVSVAQIVSDELTEYTVEYEPHPNRLRVVPTATAADSESMFRGVFQRFTFDGFSFLSKFDGKALGVHSSKSARSDPEALSASESGSSGPAGAQITMLDRPSEDSKWILSSM